ncbi:WD40 repeat-like protein [Coleophoma crateriformis]|uniref:WD40 repeat-like protein n=1 Tax=Coleophoma crateriformis TaxID=565419 RepID=A0A3D8TA97_9HELO|nr:WD40 repeat-like protein [Coleophoma crateriformis]
MSGFPAGPGSGAGNLDSLFAQLRQNQSSNNNNKPINLEPSTNYYNNNGFFGQPSQPQQPHDYEQPSVSSTAATPTYSQQPHHSSAIMSPNPDYAQARISPAVGGSSNADRTSSLLNLLKFSQPSSSSPSGPAPIGAPALPVSRDTSASYNASPELLRQVSTPSQGRAGSSSDLLAALMSSAHTKPVQQQSPQPVAAVQPQTTTWPSAATSPPADTQAYLLRLLNQPKPPQTDAASTPPPKSAVQPVKEKVVDEVGDLAQALEAQLDLKIMEPAAAESLDKPFSKETPPPAPKPPQSMFTYVNPFDQLAASSPRVRTPKPATPAQAASPAPTFQILKREGGESSDNKRKIDEHSSISSPAHTKRKIEPTPVESSGPPTPLADGRTPLEAMIGIGASGNKETVAEALSEVGTQVDKEVERALAEAEQKETQAHIEQDMNTMLDAKTESEFENAARTAAIDIKKELDKEENSGALDDLPAPVAEAVKDIIDETAQGHIADSWESADAEDGLEKEPEPLVKVYNFPMKPWITITIKEAEEPRALFRSEILMDIARLKKEFDQIDRTLLTASNNFIVYGMSKHGGIRIIRQEDGRDAKLFTETQERIFNVATSVSTADLKETIIGTGVNGTVYWAVIKDGEGDYIEDSHPETHGFALPPLQTQDQESPGGVLKTRARKSSNHPEFFAVGRGKSIHIIWPSIIMKQAYLKDGKERIVDTEKYLRHRSLKVNTGKAGKDFCFSEDDTTIVSLDKAGRVKFWDVRSLTKTTADSRFPSPEQIEPIEIKEPLITFTTTPATEKSWPTSVLFVDKLRPYQRGGALRYLIVGMKQNHTLQLWDLALGKPVQEIHLPHGKESDAVCSVLYHAATGMIIVGHPTRNSIYFLHLSAPKYSLAKSVTQAEYMEKLVSNDSGGKPESTAVISGMREYSFANKGQLRSLDILQNPSSNPQDEPPTMFELYAMHSKGVTCLSIKQADLGWTSDNKVIVPIAAEKAGVIEISALKELPVAVASDREPSQSVPQSPAPAHRILPRPATNQNSKKSTVENTSKADEKIEKKELLPVTNGQSAVASPEKTEKKKRRKATQSSTGESSTAQTTNNVSKNAIEKPTISRNGSASKAVAPPVEMAVSDSFSQLTLDGSFKGIETRIAGELKKTLGDSLTSLSRTIHDDRLTQEAVSDAKQDAMLRLVSTTLSENVEQTLNRIVSTNIQQSVLPAISDVTAKTLHEQLGSKMNAAITSYLPKEMQKALPVAIAKALDQPQIQKSMGDALAKSISFRVEEVFSQTLQNSIAPAFTTLAVETSRKVASDVQRQAAEQIATLERQRREDSVKIEQLTQLVTGLTEMVATMAAAQSEFQGEFLKMQQNSSRDKESQASTALVASEKTKEQLDQEEYDQMLETISTAMHEGNYEDAIIRWLQTGREHEFFANYFSKYNPVFIRELSPLMLLSVGATISVDLDGPLLLERVAWLEVILSALTSAGSNLDDQVREIVPKIMSIYIQRLEHLFMRISNVSAQDPLLKRISILVGSCNRLLDSCRSGMIPRAPSAASSARGTPLQFSGHRSSMSGRGFGL